MNKQTFDTFCPLFPGFYHTGFDYSENFFDYELNDEEFFRERYPELAEIPWDYIEKNFWGCIDDSDCYPALAKACVDALPRLLGDYVIAAEYQKLVSPKYYNYRTDSIDCMITVDCDVIRDYLMENAGNWQTYLAENYTSRSGFCSHYSNSAEDWTEETENFTVMDGHYLGAVLEFLAGNESVNSWDLYESIDVSELWFNSVNIDISKLVDSWEVVK